MICSRSFSVYRATSARASGDGASGGLARGSFGDSFDPRGFLWSLLSDLWDEGPVRASEARFLCEG